MSTHVAEFDCLFNDYLLVKEDEEFGRGIYTKKKLTAGTEVMKSDPVAYVLGKAERGSRCDGCLQRKEEGQLRKCSRCKYVQYCGSTCQRKDWPCHKIECKGILKIYPNIPTDTVRLLVRLYTKRLQLQQSPPSSQSAPTLPPGVDYEMTCMRSHAPRYSEELKISIASQVLGAKLLMDGEQGINMEELYSIGCKVTCNAFYIMDDSMHIGTGIYLAPTFLNHSCDPNCIPVFDGYVVKIRTMKELQPDDQLFITYCEVFDSGERRRKYLQKQHLFVCTCSRCQKEKEESSPDRLMTLTKGLSPSQSKALLNEGFTLVDRCIKLKCDFKWAEIKDATTAFLAEHAGQLGENNIVTLKLKEHLMDAHIELEEWTQVFDIAKSLKIAYELLQPKINLAPTLGLHCFKMAKLSMIIHNDTPSLKEIVSLLERSVSLLSISHGSAHHRVAECKEILMDAFAIISMRECNV